MSEFGSKTRGSKTRYLTSISGNATRRADSYNSSSLAVDVRKHSDGPAHSLRLVHPRPVPAIDRRVVSVPTFRGLDSAFTQRSPKSRVISAIVHVGLAGFVVWIGMHVHAVVPPSTTVTHVDFKLFAPAPPPPKILPVAKPASGGGGGGLHQPVEAAKGRPPEVAKVHLNAPQLAKLTHPKLAAAPSQPVTLPDSPKMMNLGSPESTQIKLASQGSGIGSSFGGGLGGGLGSGHGLGAGPGAGGGYGGGLMSVGGGVSAPAVIHSVEPEFTDQARQANFQGTVSLQLIVDASGNPQNIRVTKHLGMGLDEKAVEAVRQYRFRPATYQGHPVAVQIVVDVDFHLH